MVFELFFYCVTVQPKNCNLLVIKEVLGNENSHLMSLHVCVFFLQQTHHSFFLHSFCSDRNPSNAFLVTPFQFRESSLCPVNSSAPTTVKYDHISTCFEQGNNAVRLPLV